jgi:hypothetical protein
MNDIDLMGVIDLASPTIDKDVQRILDCLDAMTGSVAIRKALYARFPEQAFDVTSARFPDHAFLAGAGSTARLTARPIARRKFRPEAA